MVRSVSAIAIKGDAMATVVDRSARRSSTNCITQVLSARLRAARRLAAGLAFGRAPAHQQAERLARGCGGGDGLRKPAVENHRDAIGDFFKLVEVMADH